jgi:outer membrane protein
MLSKRWMLGSTMSILLNLHGAAYAAQTASPSFLTLGDAQNIAVANHPEIKGMRYDTFAVNEAVKIARSGYAPQAYGAAVQTFAQPQTRLSAYNGLNDPTVIQRTALGVGVSQYITDFGRTTDIVRASELDLDAQKARADLTRDTVVLNVDRAYFEILRAKALLVVAEKTRGERGSLLRQVTALQRAGLRSTLDVSIMARDVSEADQLVLEARGRLQDAFATLSEAMGLPVLHTYALQDVRKLPNFPANIDEILKTALDQNPKLASLSAAESAARERADAVARSVLPSVSGYGFFGATPIRAVNQSIASSYAAVGVSLNVPIFNGGALAAEKRQAGDQRAIAEANVDVERDQLLRDVHIAYDGVKTTRGNIDVSEQLFTTALQALELTRARYRIGLNSIVDLSEAQLRATQAEISHTNAVYDYILQGAALDFLTGTLARVAL